MVSDPFDRKEDQRTEFLDILQEMVQVRRKDDLEYYQEVETIEHFNRTFNNLFKKSSP